MTTDSARAEGHSIVAADLPDGSIVAARDRVWIRTHPTPTAPWRNTYGGYSGDWEVDKALAAGAVVLRMGHPGDEEDL